MYFHLHRNSQIHVLGSQRWSNLAPLHHCVELCFSNAQSCQALQCRSSCQRVVANLCKQTCGAFSRDWITCEIAVYEDCNLVDLFLSSETQLQLEVSQPNVALRFSGMRSNSRGSLILWANCFAVATSNLSWAKYEIYHTCRSVACCIFPLQNLTLPTIQHYLVLKFLSWCSHRLGLRVCIQIRG